MQDIFVAEIENKIRLYPENWHSLEMGAYGCTYLVNNVPVMQI